MCWLPHSPDQAACRRGAFGACSLRSPHSTASPSRDVRERRRTGHAVRTSELFHFENKVVCVESMSPGPFVLVVVLAVRATAASRRRAPSITSFCLRHERQLKVDATVDLQHRAAARVPPAPAVGSSNRRKFCVPTTKSSCTTPASGPSIVGQPLRDDYICYLIKCPDTAAPIPNKLVADQFGQRSWRTSGRSSCACRRARRRAVQSSAAAMQCGGACPNDFAGAPTACRFDDAPKVCTCEPQAVRRQA